MSFKLPNTEKKSKRPPKASKSSLSSKYTHTFWKIWEDKKNSCWPDVLINNLERLQITKKQLQQKYFFPSRMKKTVEKLIVAETKANDSLNTGKCLSMSAQLEYFWEVSVYTL